MSTLTPDVSVTRLFRRNASSRWLGCALLATAVAGVGGCKKDEKEGQAAEAGQPASPASETDVVGDVVAQAVDKSATSSFAPAAPLQRGNGLGHVLIPNPSGFLKEIRERLAPGGTGMFLDEAMLRNMASGQLGTRSGVAEHIDLSKPMGCVLVDTKVQETPVACILGYTGGSTAAVADLGSEGKQAEAAGHAAHYILEGEDVFIDDLEGAVVITTHAELFGTAKEYLQKNLLGRAEKVASDIETVAYVAPLMTRYEDKVKPLLEQMETSPSMGGDNDFSKAMSAYTRKSTQTSLERLGQLTQFTLGLSVEEFGVVARYAVFPVPGSKVEQDAKAMATGPLDKASLEKLPASSFLVSAMRFDDTITQGDQFAELRTALIDAYAESSKKDPAQVGAAVDAFFTEETEIYGPDFALAMMHLPGTLGGLVIELPIEKPGRESWKSWSESFTPANILSDKDAKELTWSFKADAASIGGVPVDRWVIEPTAAGKKDLEKGMDATTKAFIQRMGGAKLTIDRAEVDGRVVFTLAPGSEEKSMEAAIIAVKGKEALRDTTGLQTVLDRGKQASVILGVNAQGGADWLREVVPPEQAKDIPAQIGNDLSDILMIGAYHPDGSQSGEFAMSQAFIDRLKQLAE